MSVNCSATMMGSNDRKLKAGSSSSKPLSSCVAKGQPMCSPEELKKKQQQIFFPALLQPEFNLHTVPALLLLHCLILSLTLVFVFLLKRFSLTCADSYCRLVLITCTKQSVLITTCELTLCLQLDDEMCSYI